MESYLEATRSLVSQFFYYFPIFCARETIDGAVLIIGYAYFIWTLFFRKARTDLTVLNVLNEHFVNIQYNCRLTQVVRRTLCRRDQIFTGIGRQGRSLVLRDYDHSQGPDQIDTNIYLFNEIYNCRSLGFFTRAKTLSKIKISHVIDS